LNGPGLFVATVAREGLVVAQFGAAAHLLPQPRAADFEWFRSGAPVQQAAETPTLDQRLSSRDPQRPGSPFPERPTHHERERCPVIVDLAMVTVVKRGRARQRKQSRWIDI
jgi:hypothetical protein